MHQKLFSQIDIDAELDKIFADEDIEFSDDNYSQEIAEAMEQYNLTLIQNSHT